MGTRIQGYNILFKANNKTFLGETSTNLSVNAVIKESLEKADKGNTKYDVTSHTVTFSVNGTIQKGDSLSGTALSADDAMELALKTGSSAVIPFIYYRSEDLKSYKGNMIITSYSEDSTAEGEATYALNCQLSGEMTEVE